jgi:hypothetical protein
MRNKLGQMVKWVIISLNRYDTGVYRFNKNWLVSWPVFFIIIPPEASAKCIGCKNRIYRKVKKKFKILFKTLLGGRVGRNLGGKFFPAEHLGAILAGNF